MTTRTHFLVQMIHTKLLSNLAKLKIKPTVIATINMTELDLIELRRLYPNAWVKPYSRETKYDYDLLIIDPSNFDSTQLNEFLSLETQTLNEDRVIILSVFNHSSKEVMKKSNGNLFHQIVIDDRCILKSLKNLKKQNLFTFTSSELPMMR
ncbi:MAG: hypothetical protein ABI597_12950, partial [Gammaproteobacteria bacterium]